MRFILVLFLLFAAASSARAQGDPYLETIAARFRTQIGRPDHNGWLVADARVEGRTLIVAMVPPAGRPNVFTAEDLAISATSGFCRGQPVEFFEEGRVLRVELRSGGQTTSADITACPDERSEVTRVMARTLQRSAGQSLGDGRLASAHAEGTTLVIVLDGPARWRRGASSEQIRTRFFRGYCSNSDTRFYFDGTRTVRLDTLENGRNLVRGRPISSCEGF